MQITIGRNILNRDSRYPAVGSLQIQFNLFPKCNVFNSLSSSNWLLQDSNKPHLTSSNVKFANTIAQLKPEKLDAIKEMGFGGLTKMPNTCLRRIMLRDIGRRFDLKSQSFQICGQCVRILPEDVEDIMGLQIEGLDVAKHLASKRSKKMDKLLDDLFVRLADLNRNELTISKLQSIILDSDNADDDFKRAFVLFTIGVI